MLEPLTKKVVKNGTSLAINIPKKVAKKEHIEQGDYVEFTIKKSTKPSEKNIAEIDNLIANYHDMLDYLKDK